MFAACPRDEMRAPMEPREQTDSHELPSTMALRLETTMNDGAPAVDSMLIEVTYYLFAGGVGGTPDACWVLLSDGNVHLIHAQRSPNRVVKHSCKGGSLHDEITSIISSNDSWNPVPTRKLHRPGQYHPRI